MNLRVVCEGHFTLPLPTASAMQLFTPEGERGWAGQSWNPVYPVPPTRADGSSPGTVFTTESAGGGDAIWVVLERRADEVSYARVAPGNIAGMISVNCAPDPHHETRVTVRYDITSLGPEGAHFAQRLKDGYPDFLKSWRDEILAMLFPQ
jgi:hypothetical protein